MCLLASCYFFTACSDDDEENGGGEGGSSAASACYFEAKGNRIDFHYAYYYSVDDGCVEVELHDIDILQYYRNPDKIKPGTYYASAYIDFMGNNAYIRNGNIPEGNIETYDGDDYQGEGSRFEFELITRSDLYEEWMEEEESVVSTWYSSFGADPSMLSVSKAGKGYQMDADRLHLHYARTDQTIDDNSPVCTAKFHFEGNVKDINDLMEDEYSIQAVQVTHPDEIRFLKRLSARR